MKKLSLFIVPLMSVALLSSCGGISPECVVTFESNGGTHINTQRVKKGGIATEPNPAPTKTDYTFGGWFISPDFAGGGYDFSTLVTEDITLYADWNGGPAPVIPTYSIDFQGENCTSTLDASKQYHTNDKLEFTINVPTGSYKLPENINVSGVSTFDYNSQTGAVSFTVESKDIGVIAKAEKIEPTIQHTVTFVLNGATSSPIDPVKVDDGSLLPSDKIPVIPTNPGHTFEGWSKNEKSKDIVDLSKATINSDLILYAWWSITQSVDITFDANGGYLDTTATTTKVVSTTYGQVPIAPTPIKVVAGKTSTFKGWDKPLEPATVATTYTAQWTDVINTCHVTFDGNGGTITAGGDPIDVNYDDTIVTAPTVTRDGYGEATGWYDAPTGGNLFIFGTTKVTTNLTLYAQWGDIQSIDITFDANGGYFDTTTTTTKVVSATYGQVPIAPTPTKVVAGKTSTFKGWDKPLEPATVATTYIAQWDDVTNKCHVTFDGNGGTITAGGDSIDVDYGGTVATAPTITRDGYDSSVVEWYDAATGGIKFNFGSSTVTSNMTLYAHWGNIKTYTVVFNANGGKYGAETSITRNDVLYNTMPEIPTAPTRVDSTGAKTYTFTGYDKNVEPVTGDATTITYKAQWSEVTNKCHITFNANGGAITAGGDSIDVTYGATIPETQRPTATRDGYGTTTDWYDAATGGNLFTFGATKVTTNLTLYAHWGDIKTYTVVFNANGGIYYETGTDTVTRNSVPYNTMPTIPAAPTKIDSTRIKAYTFTGYNKNVVPVAGDATTITYTAQWEETTNICSLTINGNGGHFFDGESSKTLKLAAGTNIKSLAVSLPLIYDDFTAVKTVDKYTYSNGSEVGNDDILKQTNTTIQATYRNKTLEECSWDEIEIISNQGKAFAKTYFGDIDPENPLTKTIMVNNQPHKVKIIGYGQDKDEKDNEIGITFEFVDLISDSNGYSLATYWKNTNTTEGSNSNYLNSSVRKALTGQGEGDLNWFEKDSKSFSTTYANTSVLDMLPSELSRVLKTVKKAVNVKSGTTWTLTDFTDKLFLLNPKELGYSTAASEDSTTYKFYEGHSKKEEPIRIKAQVKGTEGATTSGVEGTDLDGAYTGTKYSYAGYNSSDDGFGAVSWLRSPDTYETDEAYNVFYNGAISISSVYFPAYGIAPAFCI